MLSDHEFVVGYADGDNDLVYLEWHVEYLGNGKLVLFFDTGIVPLFVPYLTCDVVTLSVLTELSSLNLRKLWDTQNRDLNRYVTHVQTPIEGTCSLLQNEFAKLRSSDFCPIASSIT